MFEEMVERIQRSVISVLLKVKVEMRPAPTAQPLQVKRQMPTPAAANGANGANGASAAKPVAPAPVRVFRRQMPEPLSNMSSFKAAQEAAKKAAEQKKDE